MDEVEFDKLFGQRPDIDKRHTALVNRLHQYHQETDGSVDGTESLTKWKLFMNWAKDRAYTIGDINRAKLTGMRSQ